MGHTVLAERIRELGWDRYKDMPAFNAYTAPPPNEDADDGRSAQRLCRDAHLAAESAASKAPEPAKRPPSARPSTRRRPPVNEDLTETEGQGSAQGAAAGAATGRPAGVLADPSRAHLAVRPEIMNKTPPRSHVRAMPVLSARLCVCVCVCVCVWRCSCPFARRRPALGSSGGIFVGAGVSWRVPRSARWHPR